MLCLPNSNHPDLILYMCCAFSSLESTNTVNRGNFIVSLHFRMNLINKLALVANKHSFRHLLQFDKVKSRFDYFNAWIMLAGLVTVPFSFVVENNEIYLHYTLVFPPTDV